MVTLEELREIVMSFPGVEDSTMYGQHAFKVRGRFFTRVRGPNESDAGALVLKTGFFERDALMSMDPETFFLTPHYQNYPTVLVRLDRIHRDLLVGLLTEAWRQAAPKKAVAAWDAGRSAAHA